MPFLVFLLGVMLTACGTTNQSSDNTDNSKKETTDKENVSDETVEDKSTNEKADDQSKETTAQTEDQAGQSNEDSKESSSKEITKEGTFVGLADGHTIAVNIDGKEVAISFGNSFSKQVNSLKEESKVKVTYTKDANGTLRLKTIESVKAK